MGQVSQQIGVTGQTYLGSPHERAIRMSARG